MQLTNKTILLTGASGGIGQAIATELDKHSTRLLLVGRNREKLQQLQHSLSGEHQLITADLNTAEGRSEVVEACMLQGLDVYISAIGVMDFQFVENQDDASIEQMMSTNLVAPILLCQQLIPLLKQKPQAAIVNIGSIFGSIGHPGFAAYCASKFGLRGFTEALQRELADTSIRVSYLAPRATRTDLNSSAVSALNETLGNATDSPQQVAAELIKLLAGKRKQRYMGWPENLFVRVNSIFPGIVHNALVKKLSIIRQHAEK
jgi:short-subunit dehydrogenase